MKLRQTSALGKHRDRRRSRLWTQRCAARARDCWRTAFEQPSLQRTASWSAGCQHVLVLPRSTGAGMATRMKELFRKYGKVAVGVHLTVYTASLAGVLPLQHSLLRSATHCSALRDRWHRPAIRTASEHSPLKSCVCRRGQHQCRSGCPACGMRFVCVRTLRHLPSCRRAITAVKLLPETRAVRQAYTRRSRTRWTWSRCSSSTICSKVRTALS